MQQDSFFRSPGPQEEYARRVLKSLCVRQPPESYYSPCGKKRKKQEPQHLVMMTIEALQSNLVKQCFKVSEVALQATKQHTLELADALAGRLLELDELQPLAAWLAVLRAGFR